MTARIAFGSIALMCVLFFTANAGGKDQLQRYFSDAASKVKAADNASEKREILSKSFQTMSKALDRIESSGLVSKDDCVGIDRFKTALEEKQDELAGRNGYVRVSDEQLNDFSNYVVQDMEQAAEYITISLVAALLIVIILILLF